MRSREAWEWVNEPGISREERAKRKWLTFGFMPRPMRMVVTNDSNPSRPDQKQSDDRKRSGNHV